MTADSADHIRERLSRLRAEAFEEWERRSVPALHRERRTSRSGGRLGITGVVLVIPAALALPFFVLVRGSVFFYQHHGLPDWLALSTAASLSFILATAYASWISRKLTGKPRIATVGKRVAAPLVACYCCYALLYLAGANAKSPSVREQFTALHPVLRVALSTIILVDSDLVVTSTRRALGDYRGMGLPEYAASRHLPQWDGWVHAVDLRTRGRSATQNSLMAFYFRAMGFRTLRHRGTADHLHVSLGMQQDSLAPYAPRTGT